MDLTKINELTKSAYDKTALKYHDNFRNEVIEKEYDRSILDKLSNMLPPKAFICDAGCGPSGHIGKYLLDKGHKVVGIDISKTCIDIATAYNPLIAFHEMDMGNTNFGNGSFDAVVAYYSIIYTPKNHVPKIFMEFNRILRPNGKLLIVVKKGRNEGIVDDDWYEGNAVYFSHFIESEIKNYYSSNSFNLDYLDTRQPYHFELNVDRIYAMGTKQR